jgi:AcrR family transcriptional regulator
LKVSKGDETRARILDRAFRRAGRDGLLGLSIGGLASELGLSKSGLFAHFGSKEDLELAILAKTAEQFEASVIKPALRAARGLPRLRKLFELWLQWIADPLLPGGCAFFAAAAELDDREGAARQYLVESQQRFKTLIARSAQLAIEQGHLRRDLDCEQFVFELYAIVLGYHHARRLMRDRRAEAHARAAFIRLVGANAQRN